MYRTNKVLFAGRLLRERDKLELLINRVGFARRLTMKGVAGDCSVKDIVSHILAHEQFIADRMTEALHGEQYIPCETQTEFVAFRDEFGCPDFGSPLLDENKPYEWIAAKYKNFPFDEIVALEISAFAGILSALEQMPGEMISRFNFIERVSEHTYKHYRRHTARINDWLNSIAVNSKSK
ncbi:MAG: hypothetical protein HZB19_08770 [Chloroflexi bacterium]|nr:hypothetical protein [Chloroflexota bacterium]